SAVVYLFGYSLFRFVIEFFRQPDSQFADVEKGKYIGYIFGSISMGQILSIIMMLVAVLAGIYLYKLDKTNKTSIKTKEIKNKQKKRQNKDRK
ncbi:MAG: prolipoprotein diacylglyceryl transferase, partial [Spirochaetes bacterium]|nr:prolipoprotein diacylglyceryl transferase [Spirochaetota bacterium]